VALLYTDPSETLVSFRTPRSAAL